MAMHSARVNGLDVAGAAAGSSAAGGASATAAGARASARASPAASGPTRPGAVGVRPIGSIRKRERRLPQGSGAARTLTRDAGLGFLIRIDPRPPAPERGGGGGGEEGRRGTVQTANVAQPDVGG